MQMYLALPTEASDDLLLQSIQYKRYWYFNLISGMVKFTTEFIKIMCDSISLIATVPVMLVCVWYNL